VDKHQRDRVTVNLKAGKSHRGAHKKKLRATHKKTMRSIHCGIGISSANRGLELPQRYPECRTGHARRRPVAPRQPQSFAGRGESFSRIELRVAVSSASRLWHKSTSRFKFRRNDDGRAARWVCENMPSAARLQGARKRWGAVGLSLCGACMNSVAELRVSGRSNAAQAILPSNL